MDKNEKNIETTSTSEVVEIEKAEMPKSEKLKNAYRLKYGSYATAITAVFIAVVVLLNVFFSVINDKNPLTIDMTAENAYTVNPENIEFIKNIDYKVNLRVIFTEELYLDGSYASYYRSITDNSGGKYYEQTIKLLKQYKKYNDNISLEFIDPYGSEITSIVSEYTAADISVNYGDILVECYPDGEDKEPKRGCISFNDCYELETDENDLSQYYGSEYQSYTLAGNNIEQAVANGIFKTVNLTELDVALITANSAETYVQNFKNTAKENAINFKSFPVIKGSDFSDYEVMMICSPGKDYTEAEIEVFEKWLNNDGKRGKTLMFFASPASPNLPNLYAFLEEWGIAVEEGYKYYSKDSNYYSTDRTNIYLETTFSEYTAVSDSLSYDYIANQMVPLSPVFESESYGTRKVETILQTADNDVFRKPDDTSNWNEEGDGEAGAAMMLSKDEDDGDASYVVAVASVDFLTNAHTVTKSDNGNFRLLVDVLNHTSRNEQDKYVMETKVLNDSSGAFTASTTEFQTLVVAVVFIVLIPLSLIALAVYVFIKRKNY